MTLAEAERLERRRTLALVTLFVLMVGIIIGGAAWTMLTLSRLP